jgi:hypothetical protein
LTTNFALNRRDKQGEDQWQNVPHARNKSEASAWRSFTQESAYLKDGSYSLSFARVAKLHSQQFSRRRIFGGMEQEGKEDQAPSDRLATDD